MNSDLDAGFTLVEMLVGLLVLSFSALALSTTLASAFQSHQKLEASAKAIASYNRLCTVLREIGRSQYIKADADSAMIETRILLTNAQSLSISQNKNSYTLAIKNSDTDSIVTTLLESQHPLRFQFKSSAPDIKRRLSSKPNIETSLSIESKVDNNWTSIISIPLLVSVQPDCRYDIVGRRCR